MGLGEGEGREWLGKGEGSEGVALPAQQMFVNPTRWDLRLTTRP